MNPIKPIVFCLSVVASFSLSAGLLLAADDIKVVAVIKSEIVLNPQSGFRRVLTHDGVSKSMPLWSKNGKLIAYLTPVPEGEGLAMLNVVDEFGKRLFSSAIAGKGSPYEGSDVRYIQTLEWIDDHTIMAGGSFNPSQSQYFIFDLRSRAVTDIVDDESAPVVSPDGRFVAFLSDAPHWRAEDDYSPSKLHIQEGFFRDVKDSTFDVQTMMGPPSWSSDGRMLGFVQQDRKTNRLSAVFKPLKGKSREVILPEAGDGLVSLHWQGLDFLIEIKAWSSEQKESWLVSTKDFKASRIATAAASTSHDERAVNYQQELGQALSGDQSIGEVDFWCNDCPLTLLPRRIRQ